MKARYILCSVGLMACSLFIAHGARGLTYQNDVDVEFTFEPTLSLALSGQTLEIDNLAPGSTGMSNTISISVNSNNVTGYTLSANVGSSENPTSDLTSSSNYSFASLAVGSSVELADFLDSTWGYVVDDGAKYSGLADYASGDSTRLKKTDSSGSNSYNFAIAAKAAGGQVAGNYTNKINFTVVTNYVPVSGNMQDVTHGDLELLMPEVGGTAKLKDKRDGKQYSVAKLADGNYWMTQNLDFDIDSNTTYTPADTDISANWTPSTSTYATGVTTWNDSNVSPESYDPGNLCWDGNLNTDWGGTLSNATTNCIDGSNMNYHIGNYYNWTAAVAMTNSSSITSGSVDQSICPAGWTLPKSGSNTGSGSFQGLVTPYGWNNSDYTLSSAYKMWNAPLFFPLGGRWGGWSSDVGSYGVDWSSTVVSAYYAYILTFNYDGYVYPEDNFNDRSNGYSVRCVAR